MKEEHHSQFDLSQITEYIFLGTNLCCLEHSHIQILKDVGVTAEINLEDTRQEMAPGVDVYLWLPTPDKNSPTQDQLDAGVSLLNEMVANNKKVYVHCQLGHGRSPTLVAAYFIAEGLGVEEAIQKIKDARPEIHLESNQLEALHTYKNRKPSPSQAPS